jgi:hypothetical protein
MRGGAPLFGADPCYPSFEWQRRRISYGGRGMHIGVCGCDRHTINGKISAVLMWPLSSCTHPRIRSPDRVRGSAGSDPNLTARSMARSQNASDHGHVTRRHVPGLPLAGRARAVSGAGRPGPTATSSGSDRTATGPTGDRRSTSSSLEPRGSWLHWGPRRDIRGVIRYIRTANRAVSGATTRP